MDRPRNRGQIRALIWALVTVAVLAALAVAGSATFLPGCAFCHKNGLFAKATDVSTHAAVECASCHVDQGAIARASYGYRIVFGMLLPVAPATGRSAAAPSDPACRSCHGTIDSGVVAAGGLKIKHSECAKGRTCVDCHSTVAHGREVRWARGYDMDTCLGCHEKTGAPNRCDVCHEERRVKDRLVSGPWSVTHGPQWQVTHGMGTPSTCSACHPAGYCSRCHGAGVPHGEGFVGRHAKLATTAEARCETCHKQDFCLDCHGLPMPHPEEFASEHPALIERNGETACKTCHTTKDCSTCHEKHVHPGGALKSGPVR